MKQLTITLNRMPVPTWRRPRANTTDVTLFAPEKPDGASMTISAPKEIQVDSGLSASAAAALPAFFVPQNMQTFIGDHANQAYRLLIPRDYTSETPIDIRANLTSQAPVLVDDLLIEADEGARATIIVRYTSDASTPAEHAGRIRIHAAHHANLQLIVVQMLHSGNHTLAIEGSAAENARIDVLAAELGANRALLSCNLVLAGQESAADMDVLYLGEAGRHLDITTRVEHQGKKSVSGTHVRGIMLEGSRKILRDTLDFITGSSGSKGREEESVLLLSPDVRNISIPLLLCGEDDVEGEHAASSGRLDEKTLFYLMSRGIDEHAAKELLAQAAFSSVLEKIPDAALQQTMMGTVTRALHLGRD